MIGRAAHLARDTALRGRALGRHSPRRVATYGGHATLIRAEPAVRRSVEVFQPLAPALEKADARTGRTPSTRCGS